MATVFKQLCWTKLPFTCDQCGCVIEPLRDGMVYFISRRSKDHPPAEGTIRCRKCPTNDACSMLLDEFVRYFPAGHFGVGRDTLRSETDPLERARNFLREFLTEERLYQDVAIEAALHGIRASMLWEVRDGLVRARRDAEDEWYWRLAPEAETVQQSAPVDETGFASLASRLETAPDYDPNSLESRVKALELKVHSMALDIARLRS